MLGVFGDSYAIYVESKSWNSMFEQNYKIKNYAKSGTSIWNAYKKFLVQYKNLKQVIFCYSYPHRIYHLPKELEQYMFIKAPSHELLNHLNHLVDSDISILKLITEAAEYTNDEQLDMFIYQHVFNEINRICRMNEINLINLMPFEGVTDNNVSIDISSASGTCIIGLQWVSENENNKDYVGVDSRICHLSDTNNKRLYYIVWKALEKNDNILINLKDKKFKWEK